MWFLLARGMSNRHAERKWWRFCVAERAARKPCALSRSLAQIRRKARGMFLEVVTA